MDKKKAEVDKKRRYPGKRDNTMNKRFYGKLLLLSCLVLVIVPSLLYADYYAMLKVETWPVVGSADVTKGVQFEIRVIACNEFGDQITPATQGWDYAQFADIILQSNDPNAQIKSNLGVWVSMTSPPYQIRLDGEGDRIFEVILNTVGDDKRITAQQNPASWAGIIDGFLDFKVHNFVDHFDISLPPGSQTAGVAFNITIYAKDVSDNIAKTFNDTIDIWAVIPPAYTYEPNMTPSTIAGSSFTNGVAIIPVTIYGSHPVSRLVKIRCENKVMHGGYYAAGESADFAVNPNSYAKILLLVPGEQHRPGRLIGSGKEGMPDTRTAGVAFNVQVYTTDEYWNPIFAGVPITFTSSDLAADFPVAPTMTTNPETFPVTFHTVGLGTQWIRITEGAKESVSTDIPVEPNDIFYFTFDSNVPSPQKTTDPFQIDVTAYDADSNVANYNQEAQLSCTMGAEYANPDTIQFINGRGSAWVQVTKMGLVKIIIDDGTHFVESNEFLVLAGDFNQLLVLLEGETHTPGLGDGKAGAPFAINAGESTTVTIIACDDYWNRKAIPVEISDISSLTGHIVPPLLPFSLAADGTGQCQVTFRTSYDAATRTDEPQTIRVSGGGRTTTSSAIIVNPGPYEKIVLVAPGEQLDPGTFDADGKSGSPATQIAGTPFTLTVAATDSYWNPVDSGFPATITFNSGDSHTDVIFAGLPQGTAISMGARIKDFDATMITLASPQWVTVTGGGKTTQVNIPVTHGPLDHFALSSIPDRTAGGTIFNVTITAQDQYNNRVLSFNQTADLSSTTGVDTFVPTTATFINGQSIINVNIYKATYPGTAKLNCTSGGKSGESNTFVVSPGPYAELVLILPGQTHQPGNMVEQGKSGAPFPYTVGNPTIQTTVYAVDQYWNKVHPPDPEPLVEITTEDPTHYLSVDPVNPWTLSNGEATFLTTLMTAATGQTLLATDIATGIDDRSRIDVKPGPPKKLQIIAPGETPDPGSALGKIGTVQSQVAGVSFDLTVRVVDQYWNLVPDMNGESIDLISVADAGLDARYSPKPFVAGVANFTIWLDGNNEDVDVTAVTLQPPPFVTQDTVMIHVDRGYKYVVEVPPSCVAGTLSTNKFSMKVKLVDPISGDIVTDANNLFTMAPCLAIDHSPATNPNGLGVKDYKLTNGEATFDQSYDIVEVISIAVSDTFGRGPVFSSGIDVRETALRYRVDVPNEATAGTVFDMTVSLIDIGTGKVVPTRDREVHLVPVSSAEPGREGSLFVTNVGLSRGTSKITKQRYTKAETISIKASDAQIYDPPAEDYSSVPFNILPGGLAKLQILAPGEEPRPGEMAYIETGKNSGNILVQGTEIDFLVTVQAVDQYWNLVDEFSGGSVYLSSDNSFTSNPAESSFTYGLATFIVTPHQAGSTFTIKAEAESPTGLEPQSVAIPMEVAEYRISSTVVGARTVDPIKLTVELVDSTTRHALINGANNQFIITACTANFEDAPGEVEKVGGASALNNGSAEIWVNYDTVGNIRFKVTDNFGRPEAYTNVIEIKPVRLCYEVTAPKEVEAGKGFLLTVKLIDTGGEKVVTPKEYESDRYVKLAAYSFPEETLAEGELKIKSLDLEKGEKTILQSYNLAQKIYIEASDAKTYIHPVESQPPDRSGVITVIGAPKTVLKFDGVYNEMDDALYLRSSTLISIICTSDIKAKYIYCRDNKGDWKKYYKYVEPFALSPGAHTIEYYGEDDDEHKEEINQSKTIYVSFFSAGAAGVSNRPNPFCAGRENTYIEYNLKEPSNVTITIYDLFGQEVWRKSYAAGEEGGEGDSNSVSWDGRNLSGEVVGNGGYICRVWIEKEKRHMLRKIAVAK